MSETSSKTLAHPPRLEILNKYSKQAAQIVPGFLEDEANRSYVFTDIDDLPAGFFPGKRADHNGAELPD